MLPIYIPAREFYDEKKNEFVSIEACTLELEHSLISISKWESKWKKPFLEKEDKTFEESVDYVRCMTLNRSVPQIVYSGLTRQNFADISKYIEDPMSATWFNNKQNQGKGNKGRAVTSELIYYWMASYGIPFECQKWHLNRLLALIRIFDSENAPKQKISKKDLYARNRALNSARRKNWGTRG